ncbi:DUF58 domain-containing protein [Acidiphilium acidophilum]|uniref:DUF58 domain-containing protein n=1 Tax=Acidiphilium acidophilum TaxID=76588 RepID=UPI002E8E6340|nr:DUF58 domain-containing protein [Acidiphilium acidophilum]
MADRSPAATRKRVAAAEALAARLPGLLLAAQRLAAGAASGRHGRRRAGSGEQFWQYRDLRDGDAPRSIDWRRSARGERLYIREREWEAVETLVIDVDDRPGMEFASKPGRETKRDRALILALALAALALDGGERIALFGRTPSLAGPGALDRLAAGFLLPPTASPCTGRLAVIGDWLDPPEDIRADLAARGAATRGGVLVQVLDGAECDFPFHGRVLFEQPGGAAREDVARAEAVAAAYCDRIAAQRAMVAAAAEAVGLVPLFHRTDAPPGPALAAIRAALDPRG